VIFENFSGKVASHTALGLLMSAAGDWFLSTRSVVEQNLIVGIIPFGVAHFFYMLSFVDFERTDKSKPFIWWVPLFVILPVDIFVSIVTWGAVKSHFGQLLIGIYGIFLALATTFSATAWRFSSADNVWSTRARFLGFAIFCSSDTLLMLDAFYFPVRRSQVYVMITYYAAQLLIFVGSVLHEREEAVRKDGARKKQK